MSESSGIVKDLKVVEYGTLHSAPFCARLLADLGADVVKVEAPGGEDSRAWGPFAGDEADPNESGLFIYLNAGKKSVVLDMAVEDDRNRMKALLEGADIFVENQPPGTLESFGLGYEQLKKHNPGLVMVSISPYGQSGLYFDYKGYDINCSCLSGVNAVLGEPDREPLSIPYAQCELQGGIAGVVGGLAALIARRTLGEGQWVDISVSDVMGCFVGGTALVAKAARTPWQRTGNKVVLGRAKVYPGGVYDCKDGRLFVFSQSPMQWISILKAMGDPEWSQDPRMQDAIALGRKYPEEGDRYFLPWLMEHTRQELLEMAMKYGWAMAPLTAVDEVVREPHLEARGFWAEVRGSGKVSTQIPGLPFKLSTGPSKLGGNAPALDEHGEEASRISVGWQDTRWEPPDDRAIEMQRPMEGYRILDFGWNWAGPMVGQFMADMGAEVIRIETRERLDFMRSVKFMRGFFENANRGKLSATFNIKHPKGIELVKKLVGMSDAVLENFSAGVMERNGLGYEELKKVKPDLVMLSMSAAGQFGPKKGMKGFAPVFTSFAGLEAMVGYPDGPPLGMTVFGYGDVNGSSVGTLAMLAGLYHREMTGKGLYIDLSLYEGIVSLLGEPILDYFLNKRVRKPRGNANSHFAPHGIYPSKGEDKWISIAVKNEEEWQALCRAMGNPDWSRREDFATFEARLKNQKDLDQQLGVWTQQFEPYELMHKLQLVGVAAMPVLDVEERDADPHFLSRNLWTQVEHPEHGKMDVYSTPWKLSRTPASVTRPSPLVGEHNHYVFKELLGLSEEEIGELEEEKALV